MRRLPGHALLVLVGLVLLVAVFALTRGGVPGTLTLNVENAARHGEHAFLVPLGRRFAGLFGAGRGASADDPNRVTGALIESGVPIGRPNNAFDAIVTAGGGQFMHWGNDLVFSTVDGSDPRTNGRSYAYATRLYLARIAEPIAVGTALILLGFVMFRRPGGIVLPIALAVAYFAGSALFRQNGTFFMVLFLVTLTAALITIERIIAALRGTSATMTGIANIILLGVSLGVVLVPFEAWLNHQARLPVLVDPTPVAPAPAFNEPTGAPPRTTAPATPLSIPLEPEAAAFIAERARHTTTMPESWAQRVTRDPARGLTVVEWHGVRHVLDAVNMRKETPFGPKVEGVFRIVVVGDSLTYGWGIEQRFGYPALLARRIAETRRVEVLNLGINGHQSEDILATLRRFAPALRPDLIIYGVCLNDVLPSGAGQGEDPSYALPFPHLVAQFVQRSRTFGLLSETYNNILVRHGLRLSFYSQIERDAGILLPRFERDAREIATLSREVTGRPAVAMIVDQLANAGSRRIAWRKQEALTRAGLDVVDFMPFYDHYDGRDFTVSRWEGHPNEEANAIFASFLFDHLRLRGLLHPLAH